MSVAVRTTAVLPHNAAPSIIKRPSKRVPDRARMSMDEPRTKVQGLALGIPDRNVFMVSCSMDMMLGGCEAACKDARLFNGAISAIGALGPEAIVSYGGGDVGALEMSA